MILRHARLLSGEVCDLELEDGRIGRVAAPGEIAAAAGHEEQDLEGYILLAAFAEPHAHLDKAFTADLFGSPASLDEAIETWHAFRRGLSSEDIKRRARRAAIRSLGHGVTSIRSHVDIGEGIELRGAQALIELREEMRDLVDIQVVGMTYPVAGDEGRDNLELLRQATDLGIDLIGGAPHVCRDPEAEIDLLTTLAAEKGLPLDLHMDERLETSLDLGHLLGKAESGFGGAITASHCVTLGMQPLEIQRQTARRVAATGMGIVTCPITNLYLQGEGHPVATPRGLTAIEPLLEAGALVAAGGDNVRDSFNPLGDCDPLQTAQFLVAAGRLGGETAIEMVSAAARRLMRAPEAGVVTGVSADLVAIRGDSILELVATTTPERKVFRQGRLIFERVLSETSSEAVEQAMENHGKEDR